MATSSHGRSRGRNGQFTRSVDSAERDAEAARLRAQNLSFREIAERLGYADDSGAHKAVSRALAAVPAPAVGELRALSTARIEYLLEKLRPGIEAGDVKSITEARKLIESLRRLHSADGPAQLTVNLVDQRGSELEQLVDQAKARLLAEREAGAGDGS